RSRAHPERTQERAHQAVFKTVRNGECAPKIYRRSASSDFSRGHEEKIWGAWLARHNGKYHAGHYVRHAFPAEHQGGCRFRGRCRQERASDCCVQQGCRECLGGNLCCFETIKKMTKNQPAVRLACRCCP